MRGTLFLVQYEWDPAKAASNEKKHGVTFEEAVEALEDPLARHEVDDYRSEARLNVIGLSRSQRLLFVVSVARRAERVTRIISARRADRHERRLYEENG
jgi:uncharacterized protein